MRKTLIVDIDGTILRHNGDGLRGQHGDLPLLSDVQRRWSEWDAKGYGIVVLTGRRESMRAETERQLAECHLAYDQLVMGVGGGPRYLINDKKPDGTLTAYAINLDRNTGLGEVEI
jgi:hypothetical protein